jgi:hypothetical protein
MCTWVAALGWVDSALLHGDVVTVEFLLLRFFEFLLLRFLFCSLLHCTLQEANWLTGEIPEELCSEGTNEALGVGIRTRGFHVGGIPEELCSKGSCRHIRTAQAVTLQLYTCVLTSTAAGCRVSALLHETPTAALHMLHAVAGYATTVVSMLCVHVCNKRGAPLHATRQLNSEHAALLCSQTQHS